MHDHVEVYDHPVLTAHARRLLLVVAAVAALVLGLVTPAHAAAGQLSGTVTGEGTGPLEDVGVDVYRVLPGNDYDYADSAFTDAAGAYGLSLVPGTYVIDFWPTDGNHDEEMYDDVPGFDLDGATRVVVTDGGTVHADAELSRNASISGHVDQTGDDSDLVLAYDGTDQLVGYGFVEGNGDYQVRGLDAGSYRLAFNRLSGFAFSAAQFYDNHQEQAGLASADQVTVASGQDRTGVDAVLVEGGHVTGTLEDSDGNPLRCRLQAFTTDHSLVTRSGTSDAATGAFDITGLSTGSYLVRVVNGNGCQNGMQYVDGTGGPLAPTQAAADPVAATLGGHTELSPALVYDLGPQPVNTVPPSVTGNPSVGSLLTAHHGSWSPSSHLGFHYQWLVGGAPVTGATRSTYRPVPADLGKAVAVRVTVTRGPRTASATSSATAPVTGAAASSLFNVTAPRVTGTANVGATLTVDPGTWSVPGATFSYVWSSYAKVVSVSATPTLTVPDSLFKQQLTLTVVASRAGYADGHAVVPVTAKVMPGTWGAIGAPKVKGRARVGATLTVRIDKVSPSPRLVFTWLRDGKPVHLGKSKRYHLTAADAGHRISVSVRYGRLHYDHVDVVSRPTGRVHG